MSFISLPIHFNSVPSLIPNTNLTNVERSGTIPKTGSKTLLTRQQCPQILFTYDTKFYLSNQRLTSYVKFAGFYLRFSNQLFDSAFRLKSTSTILPLFIIFSSSMFDYYHFWNPLPLSSGSYPGPGILSKLMIKEWLYYLITR